MDGATMGMSALAHRFAGQDGVLADAVPEAVGTLCEGKRRGSTLCGACQMQTPSCASNGASYASSRSA